MKFEKFITWMCIFLLLAGLTFAAVEHTTTAVNFNVASAIAFQVTIPGETNATSAAGGTATTAIEFNSTTGSESNVNPKVVGSGTAQADGTPIFIVFNTGTVNIELNMSLGAATPACLDLKYGMSWGTKGDNTLATANVTINTTVMAQTGSQDIYLETDFSSCSGGDTTSKTLYLFGYNDTA